MLFNLDTHRGLRDDTREIVASYQSDDDYVTISFKIQSNCEVHDLKIEKLRQKNCENFAANVC